MLILGTWHNGLYAFARYSVPSFRDAMQQGYHVFQYMQVEAC